jgi:hypothetical protein
MTTVQINIPQMFHNNWTRMQRQALGDALYPLVQSNLDAGRDIMIQSRLWHPSMTAGKIVGMMLDGLNFDELTIAVSNSPYLAERMVDACEILMEAAGMKPFE